VFKKFTDCGYAFSKPLALLLVSYVAFVFGVAHVTPFTLTTLFIITILLALVNLHIYRRGKQKLLSDIKRNIRIIIFQELLFLIGLVFLSYVRAHQPDIRGLEKFMDFGFINSILKTKLLPPTDMWFAGQPINYYWFGHFMVAIATKLSGIKSAITYNLMLATILGLSLTGAFSIVSTLVKTLSKKISIRKIAFVALLSAVLLNFGGNFHTPFYVLKEGSNKYWYPDATRFIGYNPETEDKTIHEFPIYSYVVSDLHAHLINLPFVILYIALLWKLLGDFDKGKATLKKLLPSGFVLGTFLMTNAWDFANYSLATAMVFGVHTLTKRKVDFKSIINLLKVGLPILVLALITVSPFLLNFNSLAEGVRFVHSRTPLWQMAILWGFPAILTSSFLILTLKKIKTIKLQDVFVLALLITSWILIVLPEVIFVKDIYITSHYRANTMFKLTYQAYVMFYLSSGYIVFRAMSSIKSRHFRLLASLFFFIVVSSIVAYPSFAINSYYGDLKTYKGLDGTKWLDTQLKERSEIISWLSKNTTNQPVILEAPGDSYTDYNVVSSYTGLPTVSGWFVHEWLWRGDSSFPQKRVTDISQIYTSQDNNVSRSLLRKYKVEYVIVGTQEREKYPNLHEDKFNQIGSVVFSSQTSRIYKVN
jgi:uncharacterized membrane protein